ncbi:Ger(x)C family spore germination protein [Neobacillus sp. DY30]|uniref:Ger(x)C family spore germination protein n=1 Tax=Neobacillus sp. DY30 TaxID=3047871 RepID=UPI0024BF3806|nr:Ger(x)C family spore germination protein [Neobacillus sp. DY30]WHY00238.1 Ger(x)C family spore germination protein [Neobacillus sp. DY30]
MRKISLIILLIFPIVLTGCWDQQLLVNRTLVNGISFDLTEEGKITAAVRALNIQSKGGGLFEIQDELVEDERPTVVGLGLDLDSKISGELDASKAHVVIIGEDLAKKGIHPFVEFFYRNRESYMSSKLIISKGKGKEILSVEKEKSPIAFFILQLLEGAEADTVIPKKNTFMVWNNILDPGKDMVLPYLERSGDDKVQIAGVALFNGDKYTGTSLSKEKSGILLALMNQLNKSNRMALILGPKNNRRSISLAIRDLRRNLEVQVDKDKKITCKIDVKMNIEILTYPQNFTNKINVKKLNQDLSDEFTKRAKEITNTLVKANCDAFGIGRQISSFHPELWKKINWDQEYKNVQIEPVVKVNIIKTGNVF